MSSPLSISNEVSQAMMLAQSAPINLQAKTPGIAVNEASARKAATEFEGVLVSQMMGQMFEGISTDGPFGGGEGEQMFRSLMLDEYGKQVAKRGGIGLADSIVKSLLSHQEAKADALARANAKNDASAAVPVDTNSDTKANTKTDAKFFTKKNVVLKPLKGLAA
ncbi:MAG: rod-binding protein [Proteobacteria bacterium]|nr:rod-binding protein [Pseudomonadota bacterium]